MFGILVPWTNPEIINRLGPTKFPHIQQCNSNVSSPNFQNTENILHKVLGTPILGPARQIMFRMGVEENLHIFNLAIIVQCH